MRTPMVIREWKTFLVGGTVFVGVVGFLAAAICVGAMATLYESARLKVRGRPLQ